MSKQAGSGLRRSCCRNYLAASTTNLYVAVVYHILVLSVKCKTLFTPTFYTFYTLHFSRVDGVKGVK